MNLRQQQFSRLQLALGLLGVALPLIALALHGLLI